MTNAYALNVKLPKAQRYVRLTVKLATQVVEVQKAASSFKGLVTKRRNHSAKVAPWVVGERAEHLVWVARGAWSQALDLLGRDELEGK